MDGQVNSPVESAVAVALANPESALLELDRLEYEDNLLSFLKGGWKYVDPAPFSAGWHLEAVAEHLEAVTRGQIKRLLINIPPRMTKSLLVSVAWPAWTWAQRDVLPLSGPQVQFLHASYAQTLSLRDSVRCRRLLSSPWFQTLWPDRFSLTGDQNAKQRFDNNMGGYRLSTSVGGALTGEGGDIIVVDDPHNTVDIESEAVIAATTMWWDESLSTRLNNIQTGAFVVIMQRLSELDLSGHILDQQMGNWTHLCLPMEYEPRRHCVTTLPWEDPRKVEGELLAPGRFSQTSLIELKQRLGPFGTAGQLQQSPVPRGGGIIHRDWWQTWPPEGELFTADGRPLRALAYPEMDYIIGSIDTAMTEKEESDYSAFTVWGLWRNQYDIVQVMLMEAWAERLQFHELVERAITVCRKRSVDRLLVEGKNNGFAVVQEIQRLCMGEGFSAFAEPVKGDKIARAHSCVPTFASGQVWAPDRKWAQKVIDQCASFPKGKNDDLVDATTQAIRHMRRIGLLPLPAERRVDVDRILMLPPVAAKQLPYDV